MKTPTFKHILSDIDKAVMLAAWHCYADTPRKCCGKKARTEIEKDRAANIHLKMAMALCLALLNQGFHKL